MWPLFVCMSALRPAGVDCFSLTNCLWAPRNHGGIVRCVCNWSMLCIRLKNDLIVHRDDRVDCGYCNCYAVCFGNYRFYDYCLAGFAYSCRKGFVSDDLVPDPWIHSVSNCFIRRFQFGYEAWNEQIENSCHANCFVFRMNTWSSADCGLLSRKDLADGPLN